MLYIVSEIDMDRVPINHQRRDSAGDHRQWPGVHRPSSGHMGLRSRRVARVHRAGQAYAERHRREFQRQVSGRVLESALVRESAGCAAGDRGVEKRLQ